MLERAERQHLLRTSFAELESRGSVAGLLFFRRLFELAPELRGRLGVNLDSQARGLFVELATALDGLDRPGDFEVALREVAAQLGAAGVSPGHYPAVSQAWLETAASLLGDRFRPAVRRAWVEWLAEVTEGLRGVRTEGRAGAPGAVRAGKPRRG